MGGCGDITITGNGDWPVYVKRAIGGHNVATAIIAIRSCAVRD